MYVWLGSSVASALQFTAAQVWPSIHASVLELVLGLVPNLIRESAIGSPFVSSMGTSIAKDVHVDTQLGEKRKLKKGQ